MVEKVSDRVSPSEKPSGEITDRLTGISPAKRALLELRLRKKRSQADAPQRIPRREHRDRAPLSFSQQRLWFLDQFEPGCTAYNVSVGYRLQGFLNVSVLEKCLNEIIRRHEILRTTFVFLGYEPVAVINPELTFAITQVDLQHFPPNECEKIIHQHITDETQRSFDLARGPLFRVKLLRISGEDHVLILTMHHIITDAWSREVLYRELSILYEALQNGKPSPLPELPIQYADYASWQRDWLRGEVLESYVKYWKKKLSGKLAVLDLPADHQRPPVQTYAGKRKPFTLSPELSDDLKILSKREGVTLFMILLAAFQTLLYRYSGQEDILVGSPIANRFQAETEELIGFFVNTLVFRSNLSGNPTFRELLSDVRQTAIEAYAHQDMPFEKLVEELQTDRDLSRNPLFQVMFIFQNAPRHSLQLPDLTIDALEIEDETSKFDLTLELSECATGLAGILEYNTDLFEGSTIDRMAEHLNTLLKGIISNPGEAIRSLPLLSEMEKQQLLIDWNDTDTECSANICIHQLFESRVKRTPEAVAAIFGEGSVTYEELNRQANQLAHYLQRQGVGSETFVGILMERSFDMLVGLLAILKAGAAYVPLDPSYPKARLSFILQDSGVPLLLAHNHTGKRLPESRARIIFIDREKEILLRKRVDNPVSAAKGDSPAYIIYTSGSTGIPKGVIGLHRGAVNRFNWMWNTFPFEKGEVCCQKTTLSFVDSVWEIFGPLLQGIPTVLIPDEILKDPHLLIQTLAAESVTRIVLVPSFLQVLLDTVSDLQCRLPKLKFWITSGEEISAELTKQFHKTMPQSILLNLYGSSEVSADCTWYDTKKGKVSPRVPIGRPISNTQIYLLDSNLQLVPIGIPGELHVGGAGLAGGYLNQPDLTKKRFIQNPFFPDSQLFKTGDLGRHRSDGNLEFLGRIDHQVKIRGYRIELGEIESVLNQHPMVRENVVIVREDAPDDRRLVAYLVANKDDLPSEADLVRFLKKRLPDYMVPAAFAFVDKLPLTPNGKIDRKALLMCELTGSGQEEIYVAPKDALELQLIGIWEKVLNRKPIGIRDSFFELGGHSLLAVRLFAYIEKTLGRRLPLATLFKAPTIEQLVGNLRDDDWQTTWSSLVEIQPDGSRQPLFLIHAAGGNVLFYRNLALHLGPDQPVYGLQSRGLDGRQPFHTRIEEMASDYTRAIKQVQPEGPYLLGGYCLGGSIALEMAHQLQAEGDDVALLALFETYNWANIKARSIFDIMHFYIEKLIFHWLNFRLLKTNQKLTFLREKLSVANERRKVWYGMAASKLGNNSRRHIGEAQHLYELWKNNDRAAKNYVPKSYPGRIIHFRPLKEYAQFDTPQARWEKIAAEGVKTYRLPVYPAGMLTQPFVKILAETLKESLAGLNHGH